MPDFLFQRSNPLLQIDGGRTPVTHAIVMAEKKIADCGSSQIRRTVRSFDRAQFYQLPILLFG
jgi:hypothetical protein